MAFLSSVLNWWNDFAKNVSAGNFRDLTDDLDQYPGLKDTVLESAWAGTKVHDRVYAVPHMKDIGFEIFWILDRDYYLKQKGFEQDLDISFEEIEPYLKAYKDDHPDDYPIKVASSGITSWQMALVDWLNMDILVGLDWNAQGTSHAYEVKCALEIPAWKERLQTVHRWQKLGYINPDAAELEKMPRAESGVVQSGQGWFSAESIWANTIKKPVYIARFDGPYLSTSSIQAMTAVSAFTEHPVEAMKLIELMNTDPWYRETARYGIEGKHYNRNVDGTIIRTAEGTDHMNVQAYTQGHVTLGALEASPFPEVPTDIHQWEKTLAGYADATVSVAMGFTPDLSSVESECNEIKKMIMEYRSKLYTGISDPDEVIPEMLSHMEDAGLRKVIAEIQSQLDKFVAEN
ncbi:MAG: ABC transporter substrate-binding protein [Lachnospiraceae bacterium]|nr:ABC transporter substrate-binding protein [Lachnospiraceae bacterium]